MHTVLVCLDHWTWIEGAKNIEGYANRPVNLTE